MAARYLHTPPDHLQPRTFGYCRVSTTQQSESGISLDEQRHRITARCHEHGWALEHRCRTRPPAAAVAVKTDNYRPGIRCGVPRAGEARATLKRF